MSLLRAVEQEFRSRSQSEDDSDVRSLLMAEADRAASQADYLLDYSSGKADGAERSDWLLRLPVAIAPAHAVEEQTLINLQFAFTALSAKKASFAMLGSLDPALNLKLGDGAETAFHLIGTRAKIAFNMLTPNEIDPAVETKSASARLV